MGDPKTASRHACRYQNVRQMKVNCRSENSRFQKYDRCEKTIYLRLHDTQEETLLKIKLVNSNMGHYIGIIWAIYL